MCFAVFSCVCAGIVVLLILMTSMRKKIHYRLIGYTGISIMILQVSFMIQGNEGTSLCNIQGYVNISATISCLVWACILSYNLYVEILFEQELSEKYYWVIGYLLPALIPMPELVMGKYSEKMSWCMMKKDLYGNYMMIFEFFVPFIASWFFNITIVLRIKQYLKEFDSGFRTEEFLSKKKTFKAFRCHPAWVNALFVLPAVYQFYYLQHSVSSRTIDILGMIGETLIGYGFGLMFLLNFFTRGDMKKVVFSEKFPSVITIETSLSVNAES
ncbi:hypothetical protein SteCoe_16662 [Stentor coeruleus]|uniref:G-protein coupled receptors family 2 profile 2 domain-containing protein n=1 Tax=Stentor coeruleus TaxID=5963 RepID=A0A1R2C0R6_9CILI|nr:hypothetical protein SteCoe_16662 [Stentor coeruleus]